MKAETKEVCDRIVALIRGAGSEMGMKELSLALGMRDYDAGRFVGFLTRAAKADTFTVRTKKFVRLREGVAA